MRVKCAVCGKEEDLSKLHKDYYRLIDSPKSVYICDICRRMVGRQAAKNNTVLSTDKA